MEYLKFINEFEKCEPKIFTNYILVKVVGKVYKKLPIKFRLFLSFLNLFLIFFLIEIITLLLFNIQIRTHIWPAIFGSFVGSFAFFVVSWCYYYSLTKIKNSLTIKSFGPSIDEKICDWIRKTVSIKYQVLFSVLFCCFIISTLIIIELTIRLPFTFDLFLICTVLVVAFGMGQGGYWAILSPFVIVSFKKANISDINGYPINPSKTLHFELLSKLLSTFAIWDAIMVSLCLVGVFLLEPNLNSGGLYYILAIILLGYLITFWTFVFPQINLSAIVSRIKQNTLSEIQKEINRLYSMLQNSEYNDLDKINQLTGLYKHVYSNPNSMFNFSAVRSLIFSLVTPTVVGILGHLIKKIF